VSSDFTDGSNISFEFAFLLVYERSDNERTKSPLVLNHERFLEEIKQLRHKHIVYYDFIDNLALPTSRLTRRKVISRYRSFASKHLIYSRLVIITILLLFFAYR